MGKTIILTDIHGCLKEMDQILVMVNFDKTSDTIISIGDMIDRGKDAYGVYHRLQELKREMNERCVLIRGNHEQMLIDAATNPFAAHNWKVRNGGNATDDSFKLRGQSIKAHIKFFEQLCFYYETDDFICAHAGISLRGLSDTTEDIFLWDRTIAEYGNYNGKLFLYGHTPMREALYQDGNGYQQILRPRMIYDLPKRGSICLDTGCVYGYKLTCMIIREDGKFLIESIDAD